MCVECVVLCVVCTYYTQVTYQIHLGILVLVRYSDHGIWWQCSNESDGRES